MTDTFTAAIRIDPARHDEIIEFLQTRVRAFVRAFDLGFFGASRLPAPIELVDEAPDLVAVWVRMERTDAPWLQVLWGMCEWGRIGQALPLEWIGVRRDGISFDLSVFNLPPVPSHNEERYQLTAPRYFPQGEQIVLLIRLREHLEGALRGFLEKALDTWAMLVLGGFPLTGGSPGESVIGATSGFFVAPTDYQWFVEGVMAHDTCMELLIRFFDTHAAHLSIIAVEFEV